MDIAQFWDRNWWMLPNGMEFFCLDSRLLCLADRHSMAGQRTSRVQWGTKVLGQNPSIRHPHHARQICKTDRKPRLSIIPQTTLQLLGKFARLPNSRSFRLSHKLPCRRVLQYTFTAYKWSLPLLLQHLFLPDQIKVNWANKPSFSCHLWMLSTT